MDTNKKLTNSCKSVNSNSTLGVNSSSFLASRDNEINFLWQNFESSGKIEDYLLYKNMQNQTYNPLVYNE